MLNPHNQRVRWASQIRPYAVLAILLLGAALLWRATPVKSVVKLALPKLTPRSVATQTARHMYPFSVIYGGAYSPEELARARKVDAVVAQHYAGFSSSVRVERMPKDTFMYVSYRKSNQVFWTKTKRRIPQGETVLSDGKNLARTRCGNRLSPKPQAPVASADEPPEDAMDMPGGPKAPLIAATPVASLPDADFFVPASPADLNSLLPPGVGTAPSFPSSAVPGIGSGAPYGFGSYPGGGGPFLPNNLLYPNGSGNSGTGTSAGTPTFGSGSGLATPEPGTESLLFLGLLLGIPTLARKCRNKAHTGSQKQ